MSKYTTVRCSLLFVAVGMMALITLVYQYWLYPHLLQPVGTPYTIDNLIWENSSNLNCQQHLCRLQSDGQPVKAVAWIPSQDAGHFVLNYSLKINSEDSADSTLPSGGRIALYPENNGRLSWDMLHLFFDEQGQGAWEGFSILHFGPPVDRFKLSVELRGSNGSLELSSLRLQEFQETFIHQVCLTLLIVVWVLLAIYVLHWLANGNWIQYWPLLVVYLLIVFGTQIPNGWFSSIRYFLDRPPDVTQLSPQSANAMAQTLQQSRKYTPQGAVRLSWLKKVGHVLLFATLVILLRWRLTWQTMWLLMPAALLALATEAAQGLGNSRSPSWEDWSIDMLGAILGLLIVRFWQRLRKDGLISRV